MYTAPATAKKPGAISWAQREEAWCRGGGRRGGGRGGGEEEEAEADESGNMAAKKLNLQLTDPHALCGPIWILQASLAVVLFAVVAQRVAGGLQEA